MVALLSDSINQAQQLLYRVEGECKKVGLGLNGPKSKSLAYNVEDLAPLKTLDGTQLELKDDFKCLGLWVYSSAKILRPEKP